MYLTLVIHLRCSLILQLNALMVFFILFQFDFEKLVYYYLNCQCHSLYQPQVYPQCKIMCKFLCANLDSAMFSNSIFGRLHFWAYLFTNNLEVVSHCNSGCSIIMVRSGYSVKLGLVPL